MKNFSLKILTVYLLIFQGCAQNLGEYNYELNKTTNSQIIFAANEIEKKISQGMTKREVIGSLGRPSHYLNFKGSMGKNEIFFHAYGTSKHFKNTQIKMYFGKEINSAILSLGFDLNERLEWVHLHCFTSNGFLDAQSTGKIIIGTPPLEFAEGTHSMQLMDDRPGQILRSAKEF